MFRVPPSIRPVVRGEHRRAASIGGAAAAVHTSIRRPTPAADKDRDYSRVAAYGRDGWTATAGVTGMYVAVIHTINDAEKWDERIEAFETAPLPEGCTNPISYIG